MNAIFAELLLDHLLPPFPEESEERAFALVDAACDDGIYPAILRADCEWSCLYRGDAAVTMATVAPYLVTLERQSRFTAWLVEEGWGKNWCVFLNASVKADVIRSHFRRFVFAQLPNGKTVYFRFYDPRVLRAYLPTCTAEELETIFGPVDRFVIEDEEGAPNTFRQVDGALDVSPTIGTAIPSHDPRRRDG